MSDGDLLSYQADIPDRHAFARFLIALADDLRDHPHDWERADLEEYLRVMAGWLMHGLDAFNANVRDMPTPDIPSWRLFADIMSAARIVGE
jgi:hypothetical protein